MALDPKNLKKLQVVWSFCHCTMFGTMEVMSFLGASWRSWADSGLKLAPKMAPKLVQNWSKKLAKTGPIFWFRLDLFLKGSRPYLALQVLPSASLCPGGSPGPISRARYS